MAPRENKKASLELHIQTGSVIVPQIARRRYRHHAADTYTLPTRPCGF